jgi:hypothetical protein
MDNNEIQTVTNYVNFLTKVVGENLKDSYLKFLTSYCEYLDALELEDTQVMTVKAKEIILFIISFGKVLKFDLPYIFSPNIVDMSIGDRDDEEDDSDEIERLIRESLGTNNDYSDDEEEEEEVTPLIRGFAKFAGLLERLNTTHKNELYSSLSVLMYLIREDLADEIDLPDLLAEAIMDITEKSITSDIIKIEFNSN